MSAINVPNQWTGKAIEIPENGSEAEALSLVIDLRAAVRDNLRFSELTETPKEYGHLLSNSKQTRSPLIVEFGGIDGAGSGIIDAKRQGRPVPPQVESRVQAKLLSAIRSFASAYSTKPDLTDFQRTVFHELSQLAPPEPAPKRQALRF